MDTTLIYTQVSKPLEIAQILDLQVRNHVSVLDSETIAGQGFVTVRHDPDVLRRMNAVFPSVIAKAGDQVVGYCLVMDISFFEEVPVLAPLYALVNGLTWKGKPLNSYRWFGMGQVCIDEQYRGRGIFDGMYAKLREVCSPQFDFTLTEVAVRNIRSIKAHKRVGFQLLHRYKEDLTGETWDVIGWDWEV